ncbi:MAG TPA: DUF378 domain-containing protein [Patescibacteria group bacterium]|nr:DUF378 domain-containing protein [Patescibacteria group bacterium]
MIYTKILHIISFILIVIGGLNWGLWGAFDFNLVNSILGSWPALENLVYILVGIAAIVELVTHKGNCKMCTMKAPGQM